MIRENSLARTLTTLLAIGGAACMMQPAPGAEEGIEPSATAASEQKAAEAEIWALEQAYWEYNRGADYERIISTWHDQFLGWPEGEPRPVDKQTGARYVRKSYAEPGAYSFKIEPTGIRVLGNVAVNHYTVRLTFKDGKRRSMRITHTWIRENAGWKVLGGMSAGP
jgi:ketosteroid isomerase-like protein